MPKQLAFRDLEAHERRVALMRLAGSSESAIANMLETSIGAIQAILKRPRVADFMLKLQANYVDDLRPAMEDLDDAIQTSARRAFEVETEVMERLFSMEESVRAQIGAASTAQDILDRAGKRAPVRTQNLNLHAISPQSIEQLGRIFSESKGSED